VKSDENIVIIEEEELRAMQLSEAGQIAREVLLNDLKLLENMALHPS
jgi:hypothetical protein